MQKDFSIEDESNDKKYFSMLPHYILDNSTAVEQALYMQIKRFVGEKNDGLCWTSKKSLKEKLGIGHKSLSKSMSSLLEKGWIKHKGKKKICTSSGEQKIDVYSITDIWKVNTCFYQEKGCSERNTLPQKGCSESNEGCSESNEGCSESNDKGVASRTRIRTIYKQEEEEEKEQEQPPEKNGAFSTLINDDVPPKEIAKVIHAFEAIDPKNKNYYKNKMQRQACAFLIKEYTLVQVLKVVDILPQTNVRQYYPTITTPSQLQEKWIQLHNAVVRNQTPSSKKYPIAFS